MGNWCKLVGFIIKKFVTMHGHMNVKFVLNALTETSLSTGTHSEAGPNLQSRQEKDMPSWMMNQASHTTCNVLM
jgi:hypothetical protein